MTGNPSSPGPNDSLLRGHPSGPADFCENRQGRQLIVASFRGFVKGIWGKVAKKVFRRDGSASQKSEEGLAPREVPSADQDGTVESEDATRMTRELQAAQLSMITQMVSRKRIGELQTHLRASNNIASTQTPAEYLQQHLAGVPDVTSGPAQAEAGATIAGTQPASCCANDISGSASTLSHNEGDSSPDDKVAMASS